MQMKGLMASFGVSLLAIVLALLAFSDVASAFEGPAPDETRIIIRYKSEDVKAEVMDIAEAHFGRFIKEIEMGQLLVYSVPTVNLDLLNNDRALSDLVDYVELDRRVHACYTPNDTYWPQWNMTMVDVDYAWDVVQGDAAILVAVLDTGCDYTHVDLAANVDETLGWDYVNNDSDPMDDESHGTQVSGIICSQIDNNEGIAGMAQVTVMPMKVLDASGSGWTSNIVDAIYDAGNWGANVMNMSYGASWYSSSEANALVWAHNAGVVLVAASGNEGTSSKSYPAAYNDVLGVGAVNSAGNRMSWSNYGDNVEIMAPGSMVLTPNLGGGYAYVSGTSIASPHVAGAAALGFSFQPTWPNQRIEALLEHWADDMGTPGYDTYNGWGLLDCWNANGLVFQDPGQSD